jgi:hypothetical protein
MDTCKFAHTCPKSEWGYWTDIAYDREDTRRLHDSFASTRAAWRPAARLGSICTMKALWTDYTIVITWYA